MIFGSNVPGKFPITSTVAEAALTISSRLVASTNYDQLFRQSSVLIAQRDLDDSVALLKELPPPAAGEESGSFFSSLMQAVSTVALR